MGTNTRFTGYINLDGVHIEDGIKNPPIAFQETETCIILRWLHTPKKASYCSETKKIIKNNITYEKELRLSKRQVLDGLEGLSSWSDISISCEQALWKWLQEKTVKNELYANSSNIRL